MKFEKAHAFCATLPETVAEHKWGKDVSWTLDRRMFAHFAADDGGQLKGMMLPVGRSRFLELTDQRGFGPAPYLARAHWVSVTDRKLIADVLILSLLARAYRLTAAKLTKKKQRELAERHRKFDFAFGDDARD